MEYFLSGGIRTKSANILKNVGRKDNMKDFLGNYINVGDEVIYLKLLRTGSSSKRKIMFKGKVLNFKGQKVEVSREYTNEWNIEHPESDLIFPKDVVVLEEKEIETKSKRL